MTMGQPRYYEYGPYAFMFWDDIERSSPGNEFMRTFLDRYLEKKSRERTDERKRITEDARANRS